MTIRTHCRFFGPYQLCADIAVLINDQLSRKSPGKSMEEAKATLFRAHLPRIFRPFICAIALLLQGCFADDSPGGGLVAPAAPLFELQTYVSSERDDFKKVITLNGIQKVHAMHRDVIPMMYFLTTKLKTDSGAVTHSLLFVDAYHADEMRRWKSAFLDTGRELPVTVYKREIMNCDVTMYGTSSGCNYMEGIGIAVPEGLLEEFRDDGFPVKIYGQSAEPKIISVTVEQITGQLDALAEARDASLVRPD